MDPLIEALDTALDNFTAGMNITISSADCSRRLGIGDVIQATDSLAKSIKEGLSFANERLDGSGFVLSAEAIPYFNFDTFSIGVNINLSAAFKEMAADVLEIVSDFVKFSVSPSEQAIDKRLGLGYDDPVIEMPNLASNAVFSAGMNVNFGVDFNLAEIKKGLSKSYPFGMALRKGISLRIDTWDGFAEIVADPIELSISLRGKDVEIRDSHFVTAAELRSRGRFVSTIDDMLAGGIEIEPLKPDLTVPFSAEIIFDMPVTDDFIISPIMTAESDNVMGRGVAFNFDVDISTFLYNPYMGENTLLNTFQTAASFLHEVASLKLELNPSDIPSSLEGFFDIVNELNDLGEELLIYIDIVTQGECQRSRLFFNLHLFLNFLYSPKLDTPTGQACN
jgi:hypothetical protein